MNKTIRLSILVAAILLIGFLILNSFFPFDGYYKSIDVAIKHNSVSLKDITEVKMLKLEDNVYIVEATEQEELYILQCNVKNKIQGTKYKIINSNGYSVKKALNYLATTGELIWTNQPEINIKGTSYFKWCLMDENHYSNNPQLLPSKVEVAPFKCKDDIIYFCYYIEE